MERPRREKKSRVDVNALNALSNAKRGVVSRKDQHQVCMLSVARTFLFDKVRLTNTVPAHVSAASARVHEVGVSVSIRACNRPDTASGSSRVDARRAAEPLALANER